MCCGERVRVPECWPLTHVCIPAFRAGEKSIHALAEPAEKAKDFSVVLKLSLGQWAMRPGVFGLADRWGLSGCDCWGCGGCYCSESCQCRKNPACPRSLRASSGGGTACGAARFFLRNTTLHSSLSLLRAAANGGNLGERWPIGALQMDMENAKSLLMCGGRRAGARTGGTCQWTASRVCVNTACGHLSSTTRSPILGNKTPSFLFASPTLC